MISSEPPRFPSKGSPSLYSNATAQAPDAGLDVYTHPDSRKLRYACIPPLVPNLLVATFVEVQVQPDFVPWPAETFRQPEYEEDSCSSSQLEQEVIQGETCTSLHEEATAHVDPCSSSEVGEDRESRSRALSQFQHEFAVQVKVWESLRLLRSHWSAQDTSLHDTAGDEALESNIRRILATLELDAESAISEMNSLLWSAAQEGTLNRAVLSSGQHLIVTWASTCKLVEEPFSLNLAGRKTVASAQGVKLVQKTQDLAVGTKSATEVLQEDSGTHTEKQEKSQNPDAVVDKCDKCDGPHPTDACPHFKKAREKHKDAWVNYGTKHIKQMGSSGGNFVLRNARCVPQPGDGSCLFHSLCYGLHKLGLPPTHASQLRKELMHFLRLNSHLEIAGDTLEEWVNWDANTSVASYASRMSLGGWGGGIEMATCSLMKRVNIHVYEKQWFRGGYKRISCFDCPDPTAKSVHVLYQGGVHYDALNVS